MKVILIEPKGVSQSLHCGFAYIAAQLNLDIGVKVYDLNFLNLSPKKLQEKIKEENPDLVGISIKSANLGKALKIASLIREVSRATLVCGGPHITLCGLEFFKQENKGLFDFGITSEAEKSFNMFIQSLNGQLSLENVPGLIYHKNDAWQTNPIEAIDDLNGLSRPNYSVFQNIDLTKMPYPLLTSRGCPYLCIYCSVGMVSGKRWRFRNPANILEELILAHQEYNFKSFEIIDDNFTLNPERVKEFCRLLISSSLQLTWQCPNGIRADRLDLETAKLMKQSGCMEVSLGIESGNCDVFSGIKKGEDLKDVVRAVSILKESGIRVSGFLIIGLPGDSLKATKETIRFLKKLKLDGTKWNFLIPYPKTELWDWVKIQGSFLTDFTEGQHFSLGDSSPVPVFETTDFSAKDRIKAYKIANLATGNYKYVFNIPQNKILYYIKLIYFLVYYSPLTLFEKFLKLTKNIFIKAI